MKKLINTLLLGILSIGAVFGADPMDESTWSVNPGLFTYSMNITVKLNVNCVELASAANKISAFVGSDCRGVESTNNIVSGQYLAFLTVYSNNPAGEDVKLMMYDNNNNLVHACISEITFQDGATYGFPSDPFVAMSNAAPSDIQLSSYSIDENVFNNSAVGSISSIDSDLGQGHGYVLVTGDGDSDNANFSIVGGELLFMGSPNYEAKANYSVRIRTVDDGGCSYEKAVAISVNDINDPITDLNLSSIIVDENNAQNESIAQMLISDQDVNDSYTYSFSSANGLGQHNSFFTITPSGELLANNHVFDFESIPNMHVQIKVEDQGGSEMTKNFNLQVINKNDVPTSLWLENDVFDENKAIGSVVSTLLITDQDQADSHSFSFATVAGSDNADFTIVSNQIRNNKKFNFEDKQIYYLYIIGTDEAGASIQRQLILNIADKNDVPTNLSISNTSIPENLKPQTFVGLFATEDEDEADVHNYSFVPGVGDNDNHLFRISNDSLYTDAVLDKEQQANLSIRVGSNDGAASVSRNFSLVVSDENDGPTDIILNNLEVKENLDDKEIGDLAAVDIDVNDAHSFALVSGTGSDDNALFKIIGSKLYTNVAIDFEQAAVRSIRVRASDASGQWTEKIFSIDIEDQNDAPSMINLNTNSFAENQAKGTAVLSFSTVDQDAQENFTYTFNQDQQNDNHLFAIIEDQLILDASFNYEDKELYIIRISTTDKGGLVFTKQFEVNVLDDNDPPTALMLSDLEVPENVSEEYFVGSLSMVDEDLNESFSYQLVSNQNSRDNAKFTIRADSLFMISAMDYEVNPTAKISIKGEDAAGASLTKNLQLTLLDINDAPTAINISANEIAEHSPAQSIIGQFSTEDQDQNDQFSYSFAVGAGDADNNKFILEGNLLRIKSTPVFNLQSSYSILVSSMDMASEIVLHNFTISIQDVNEKPSIEDLIVNVEESENIGAQIGQIEFSDPDQNDILNISIKNPSANPITIDQDGYIFLSKVLDYESKSNYSISVAISDAAGLKDSAMVILLVEDIIEVGGTKNKLPVNQIVSPNADGKNDNFAIKNVELYKDFYLKVYNEAGTVVFQVLSNYDNSWDATYNGVGLETGTYYYILQNNKDLNQSFKGSFTIIR